MAAYKDEIRQWLLKGIEKKATHVVVVCDTFDNSDYPVYVMPLENVREVADLYRSKSMQRVTEVYNLAMDIEPQLAMNRVMFYDIIDLTTMSKKPEHNPPTEAEKSAIDHVARNRDIAMRVILSEFQIGKITIDQCIKELDQIAIYHK